MFAVELDRNVAADARDQFVEPQLNGLADFVKLSELTASSLLDAFNHVSLGRACGPLVLRFQDDEAIGDVRRHGIGGDLGGARLGEHQFHFRSEEHTSEPQSLMRLSYAVFCLKKKNIKRNNLLLSLSRNYH